MTDLTFTSFSGTERPTAFGIYDTDASFQSDADKVIFFVQRFLGAPVIDSEIDIREIWTCFEQATIEYSQTINQAHARNSLLDMLGSSTSSLSGSENIFPNFNNMEFVRNVSMQYSNEVGTGGNLVWRTGSVQLNGGQQKYDLWPLVSSSVSGTAGKNVVIRKIHHYESVAAYRFFDTTSVMNYLNSQFNFQSYSPETIFYLLPIWEDVLRGNQLALNQRVRRSNYSFDLKNTELTVYPIPGAGTTQKIFFEYTVNPPDANANTPNAHLARGVVSNISNIAFGHIGYSSINSIGKTWIWKMTLAMCKETLGLIRSKYKSLPIPGGNVDLNGGELISLGREEQANLRNELKEILEAMTYKNLMLERNEIEEAALRTLTKVPLFIYKSR